MNEREITKGKAYISGYPQLKYMIIIINKYDNSTLLEHDHYIHITDAYTWIRIHMFEEVKNIEAGR